MSIYENFKAQILELNLIPEDGVIVLSYSDMIQHSGWCMPSRSHLYSMDYDVGTPVEEDNVFAPREVEVVA